MLHFKKNIEIEEGDYYITPEGYKCFTEQYHLKRGYCCESNCRLDHVLRQLNRNILHFVEIFKKPIL